MNLVQQFLQQNLTQVNSSLESQSKSIANATEVLLQNLKQLRQIQFQNKLKLIQQLENNHSQECVALRQFVKKIQIGNLEISLENLSSIINQPTQCKWLHQLILEKQQMLRQKLLKIIYQSFKSSKIIQYKKLCQELEAKIIKATKTIKTNKKIQRRALIQIDGLRKQLTQTLTFKQFVQVFSGQLAPLIQKIAFIRINVDKLFNSISQNDQNDSQEYQPQNLTDIQDFEVESRFMNDYTNEYSIRKPDERMNKTINHIYDPPTLQNFYKLNSRIDNPRYF